MSRPRSLKRARLGQETLRDVVGDSPWQTLVTPYNEGEQGVELTIPNPPECADTPIHDPGEELVGRFNGVFNLQKTAKPKRKGLHAEGYYVHHHLIDAIVGMNIELFYKYSPCEDTEKDKHCFSGLAALSAKLKCDILYYSTSAYGGTQAYEAWTPYLRAAKSALHAGADPSLHPCIRFSKGEASLLYWVCTPNGPCSHLRNSVVRARAKRA